MNEISINTYGSPALLKSRLQRLLELSGLETIQLDTIEFRWAGPEVGWLDLDVLKNGDIAFQVSIGYFNNPFSTIVNWLVQLTKQYNPNSILDFDIERYQMQICCDYLGSRKKGNKDDDVALFTFSLDWDDNENPAYFILPVYEFIGQLYYSLNDYFQQNKTLFQEEWMNPVSDELDIAQVESELTSKELELLVVRKN